MKKRILQVFLLSLITGIVNAGDVYFKVINHCSGSMWVELSDSNFKYTLPPLTVAPNQERQYSQKIFKGEGEGVSDSLTARVYNVNINSEKASFKTECTVGIPGLSKVLALETDDSVKALVELNSTWFGLGCECKVKAEISK